MHYLRTKSGQMFRATSVIKLEESKISNEFLEALVGDTWVKVYDVVRLKQENSVECYFVTDETATKEAQEPAKSFSSLGKPKFSQEVMNRMATWKDDETNPDEIFLFGLHKHGKIYLDGSSGIGKCTDEKDFNSYKEWYNKVKGKNSDYLNAKQNKPWLLFRSKTSKVEEVANF